MKILVISLAGNGDTLLATPFIHELRASFPDATIDVLVRWPGAADLLAGNPHVNRVHQKDLVKAGKAEGLKFLWGLRRQKYDVSINTHPQSKSLYRAVARVVGARLRVSHEYECSGWLDRWLVNRTLPQDYAKHTIENNQELLPLVGARALLPGHEMEIYLTPAEEAWAESFLAARQLTGRRRLGLHAGSGDTKNLPFKRWPLGHYVELVKRLNRERPDLSVMLFGGPQEQAAYRTILAAVAGGPTLVAETGSFRQTAALMKRCDAFLSVDTVLMHVAATVKVPGQIVIEAFTLNPTNVPFGNPYTLVPNPAVAGRHLDFYRYDGADIKGTPEELVRVMSSVTVEEVYRAVVAALP
jgi:heptosyltransferase-2